MVVELDVVKATDNIVLHAHQLSVFDASIDVAGGSKQATGIAFDLGAQTVTFKFAAALPVGPAKLRVSFVGTLNDELAGFYRSKYTLRGETRYAAVTQFEATDARRCFPCVDEPAAKAVYALTVTAPADRRVISNMHAIATTTSADGKLQTVTFADTPKMSTYLVGLFIGDFDSLAAYSQPSNIHTTIYAPVGKSDQGRFALRVACEGIEFLQQLFGVKYMGTKCDHIAIADFAAGAMENLGAISYREAALLIDEATSSLAQKQRVAQVVSHELSHQWFGDLTTMKWWDGLWLNEGFAKHMEYAVTCHLFPEWDVWSTFTASVQSSAFSLDAMASTHPIEVPVQSPDEINEIFDTVSYHKGASVIRMMFQWLGQEVGFKGLNLYLSRFSHANAVTVDLWNALAEVSGQPVAAVMQKWTATSGYPYVHVSSNAAGQLCLTSQRFIAPFARNGAAWPEEGDFPKGASVESFATAAKKYAVAPKDAKDALDCNEDWCIPLSVVASGKDVVKAGVLMLDPAADPATSRSDKLAKASATLTEATRGAAWFKLNAGHTNFFRTVYDTALLTKLEAAVATPKDRASAPALGTTDRIGLVGDAAASVSLGMSPASGLLSFLLAFVYETDYNVWSAVLEAVSDLRASCEALGASAVEALDRYICHLLREVVPYVGWEAKPGEHANTPLLRASVLRIGAIAGMTEVVTEALKRFDAYVDGKGSIVPDLKQLVYNTAASHGGAARWQALLKLFKQAQMSEEQRRLMTGLGRASDPALLQSALEMMLTDDVRTQDAVFLLGAVASNPGDAGRRLSWEFVKSRWDVLVKRFGGGNFLWSGMLGSATRHFDNKASADEIQAWFSTHSAGSAERTIKQSIEGIRTRAWKAHVLSRDPADGGFIGACSVACKA